MHPPWSIDQATPDMHDGNGTTRQQGGPDASHDGSADDTTLPLPSGVRSVTTHWGCKPGAPGS